MHIPRELLHFSDYFHARTDEQRAVILRALEHQSFDQVPLLLNIQPYPFESLESLLFRAAARNKLKGISALCQALGLPKRSILNPQRDAQLSTSMHVEIDALTQAIPKRSSKPGKTHLIEYGGHCLRHDQLALSTTRLCPLCVLHTGYGRSYWMLAPFSVCEIHGTALIDHCPSCDAPISMGRISYVHCRCGKNFLDFVPKPASQSACNTSQLIASVFKRDRMAQGALPDRFPKEHLYRLDLYSLLDLVTFLGGLQANQKVAQMRKLKGTVSVRLALKSLERAALVLADWPHGFYAELRKARAFFPQIESFAYVAKSLDHVLALATIAMPQKDLRFVSEEIGNFLAKPNEWNEARKQFSYENGAV